MKKPSEAIEEKVQLLINKVKAQTEFNKLTDIEKSVVLPTIKVQAIIEWLDEVAVEMD